MIDIQKEHAKWIKGIYPNQPRDVPAAGMVEEAGELLHCVLALRRNELWGEEARRPRQQLREDLVDAIGDCYIYLVSYCNAADWNVKHLESTLPQACRDRPRLVIAVDLVRIAAEFSASHYVDFARLYYATLRLIANEYEVDFESAVSETWAQVKERKR